MHVDVLKFRKRLAALWTLLALLTHILAKTLLLACIFVSFFPDPLCFVPLFLLEKSGSNFAQEQKLSKSGPGFSKYGAQCNLSCCV